MSSWFSKITGQSLTLDNLENVLELQLRDLYSAEDQLISALPRMAAAAHSRDLKSAFETHLRETRQHKTRLEQAFRMLGCDPKSESCEAMEGMIEEGQDIISMDGDPEVKDAALIAAAQRVEHYEIAAYGTARTLADQLDLDDAKDILDQTLDEESHADSLLTKIATGGMFKSGVNQQATQQR
jgi:ferritin-like metal-binding protein YciE